MSGRTAFACLVGVAAALLIAPCARAGGIVDITARAVTEQIGRDLKQPIVIEDRSGANSNIGTAAVARSEGDSYTWLVTGPAVLVNPTR